MKGVEASYRLVPVSAPNPVCAVSGFLFGRRRTRTVVVPTAKRTRLLWPFHYKQVDERNCGIHWGRTTTAFFDDETDTSSGGTCSGGTQFPLTHTKPGPGWGVEHFDDASIGEKFMVC